MLVSEFFMHFCASFHPSLMGQKFHWSHCYAGMSKWPTGPYPNWLVIITNSAPCAFGYMYVLLGLVLFAHSHNLQSPLFPSLLDSSMTGVRSLACPLDGLMWASNSLISSFFLVYESGMALLTIYHILLNIGSSLKTYLIFPWKTVLCLKI